MVSTETEVRDLVVSQPAVLTLTPASVVGILEELGAYHAAFAAHFKYAGQQRWFELYVRGLLVADVPRKNVEAMALRLLGAGPQADNDVRTFQHFLSEGVWDDAALLRTHWELVEQSLGEADGVLTVDGSDIPKQGTHSAGVARQYCGVLGKRANCQAGVFVGYASRRGYTLLDRRLYLPEQWFGTAYRDRWQACAIPPKTEFATKPALAAALVEAIRASGKLHAQWLTCDEGFGNDPAFLDRVAACTLWYLAEVSRSTQVWPLREAESQAARAAPSVWVPPPTGARGPVPTRERLHPDSPPSQAVETWAAQVPAAAWERYRILEGSKGPLLADFAAVRVVTVRDRLPGPTVWLVIRRSVPEPGEAAVSKYYLSNAPADLPLIALVWASGMRWPMERCFTESKDELGLDHYECRYWRGWHHHMTLVILAHHFLVRLQGRLNQREGGLRPDQHHADRSADRVGARYDPPVAHPRGLVRAPATAAGLPEPDANPAAATREFAATGARPYRGAGVDPVSAATQTGGLCLPSLAALAHRPASVPPSHDPTRLVRSASAQPQPSRPHAGFSPGR